MPDKGLRTSESKRSNEFLSTASIEIPADLDDAASHNSADEVIGEIGLVLVITLGAVLAINMILLALHIG